MDEVLGDPLATAGVSAFARERRRELLRSFILGRVEETTLSGDEASGETDSEREWDDDGWGRTAGRPKAKGKAKAKAQPKGKSKARARTRRHSPTPPADPKPPKEAAPVDPHENPSPKPAPSEDGILATGSGTGVVQLLGSAGEIAKRRLAMVQGARAESTEQALGLEWRQWCTFRSLRKEPQ